MLNRAHLVLVVLSCAVLSARAAEPAEDALARQLVQVMQVDERAARQMHRLAEAQYRADTLTRAQHDCILAGNRTEFTERLASLASRGLTMQELRAAIAYFESDVGRRHLESIDDRTNVSSREWAQRRAFLDSSAGYALITRSLLNGSQAQSLVRYLTSNRMHDCEAATEASPKPPREAS